MELPCLYAWQCNRAHVIISKYCLHLLSSLYVHQVSANVQNTEEGTYSSYSHDTKLMPAHEYLLNNQFSVRNQTWLPYLQEQTVQTQSLN